MTKSSPLLLALLALSLAANGYFAVREHRATASSSSSPSHTAPPSAPASLTSTLNSSASAAPTIWQRLAQGDPTALAALRAAGWPDDTLRLLATALVEARLRAQRKPFEDLSHNYWRENRHTASDFAARQGNHAPDKRDKETILKTLFGDAYLPPETQAPALQGIPPPKATAVLAIKADYAALRRELYTSNDSAYPEKQLALLTREERADIARALTPSEFFEYELRTSVTASELRYNTAAFEPTEAEFRALFRIKNALDEPAFDLDSAAARKLRKDTEVALDREARPILGEERFQQFVLSRDAEYRRFYHLSQHLQLPAGTARAAYELKAGIDQRSRTLDADPNTTPEARLALAHEAEARLLATFGPKGIEIYKLNSRYLELLRRPPSERPRSR